MGMHAPLWSVTTPTRKTREMNDQSNSDLRSSRSDPADQDRERRFNTLIGLSSEFGNSITSAFAKNIAEGKKFDDVLKSVRKSLVETGLKMALAPLQISLSQGAKNLSTISTSGGGDAAPGGLIGGLLKGIGSLFGSLSGGGGP